MPPQPRADGPELLASVQAGVDAPVAATLPKAAPLDLPAAQRPGAGFAASVAPAAPTSAEPALADQVQPVAVVTGRPALTPAPRPAAILAAAAVAAPVEIAAKTAAKTSDASSVFADPALANARPLPRPRSNAQPAENAVAATFADPALANARPLPRPAGILAAGREARLASAPASLLTSAEISAAENALTAPAPTAAASPLALSVSRIPAARPKGLKAAFEASRDAQIVTAAAASAAPEPATQQPPEVAASNNNAPAAVEADSEPEVTSAAGRAGSRSVVAKQATIKNAINLNNVNLVGVFGSQSNRYALIRQPSGTFKKLKVGDRFDGGKVAAITESEVRYAKGGEMLALTMPKT
ncbi:MAG: hypothetical protein U5N55_07330 [Cypionkella sp.]|nr:hypothetical protein [Cypionkella sp.]